MIHLLWLALIAIAFAYGSVPGLLAILCLFVMEAVLDLKRIVAHAGTLTRVFTDPGPDVTPERAQRIGTGVMTRVQQDLALARSRRVH